MTDDYDIDTTPLGDVPQATGVENRTPPLWRRILSLTLAFVAIIAILLSLVVTWEKRVLTDEDRFVAILEDIPSNEAVATVLSERVAERIVERSGMTEFVVRVLPDPLEFLAAPLTAAVTGTIEDTTYDVITSDGFTEVWVATLRITHRSVSAVLSGGGEVVPTDGGTVAIDLDAIAGAAVARVESRGIPLPNLDIEFGEIVLYESEQLATAQSIASVIDTVGWLVLLVTLILIATALFAAPDRRRMTAFLAFGTALGLLITLAGLRTGRNVIFGGIESETSRDAGLFVWAAVTEFLVQAAWALMALSLVIGFVAWMLGPSRAARSLNRWTRSTIDRWGQPEDSEPHAAGAFFTRWKRAIEVAIVVLAALFVLFGPTPSAFSVIATAIVTGVLIGVVEIIAGPAQTTHIGASASEADDAVEVDQ